MLDGDLGFGLAGGGGSRGVSRDGVWIGESCDAGSPGTMSLIAWNCRGLGNHTTVQVLLDLVQRKKPRVLFLCEMFVGRHRIEHVRKHLGFAYCFAVDSVGRRGGLALLWKRDVEVVIQECSLNHIDAMVRWDVGSIWWRCTGYYGFPERS